MAETEDYFPRGGKKPTTTYFKKSENFLGTAGKGDRKKKKIKKKGEDDDGYLSDEVHAEVDQSYKTCGIWLNYKVVKEGLLLLGRVRQVLETKVNISLPCRMHGVVMACHISETYNKMLEDYVNDKTDAVCELPQMFRPGQYVAVKVLEVATNHLMLTTMPQHINSGRLLTDLHKGALLQAAVVSVEDHGYVMDIGIPNTRAFLPKDSSNPEVELDTGMLTWVTIRSAPTDSVISLSGDLPSLQRAYQRNKTNVTVPATALELIVDKPLDNGIEGHVMDKTKAYIQRHHVDTAKGKKPALGQKIRARLLYMVPPKKTPFLTMKGIFDTTYPDLADEQKLREGDIVDEAKVLKITGRSVHLKLGEGSMGILSLRRVAVHEDLTDEQVLAKSYPIGSTHRVRVLCYNLSDYVYSVSDSPAVLAERPFRLDELSVGELVAATVVSVADDNLRVNVGRVNGYVPQSHMSDAGVFVDPKKATNSKLPKKKFKVGQEVKARVLSIDHAKHHLVLTLKPTLLDPELTLLTGYEQAVVGRAYTGVVAHIKEYLLVSFFNNTMAYVPKRFVSSEQLENINEAFHVGQIVKCTIMTVNPETKKMSGSLITAPSINVNNKKKANKRKNNDKEIEKKENDIKKRKISDNIDNMTKEMNIDEPEMMKQSKKDKKKNKHEIVDCDTTEKITSDDVDSKKLKKKISKDNNTSKDESSEAENMAHIETKKRKKVKDKEEQKEEMKDASEESDAIDTDIHEDSDQVLTPHDLSLIDLTDCVTGKNYKKRVVSLIKAIKARTKRLERVNKKISIVEAKGLNAKNKKYHTAMNMERLVIEERIKKLMDTLKIVQDKLKDFDLEENTDYKKKKLESATVKAKKPKDKKIKAEKIDTVKVKVMKKPKEKETIKDSDDDGNIDSFNVKVKNSTPGISVPITEDFWSESFETVPETRVEESSSSEEEQEEKPKKKRKKLTIAEKTAKAREEEERVRELEKRAIESENAPRSSDQFERALLAEPNCSQLWIAYMAFHLQATEIDKARAVGRRALNTINFREEGEKLNVWLALLNLEHRFGTKESQQKTLEDALQMNDTYQIHTKLLDILLDTSKQQELVSLVELMMRKYRKTPEVYQVCGEACYKAGLLDKARHVMQKGIAALEKKDHVSLLVRFAQLERLRGDRERFEALFEQVLAVYPQRVDVCAAYCDALRALGDVDRVRQVMERMTSQKLPARKMKVLFKKWIEVEEKIGDEEHVENIRQRALEFINQAKF